MEHKYKQNQRVVACIDGELSGGTILKLIDDPDYPYKFIEFGKPQNVNDCWELAESWETNDEFFIVGDVTNLEQSLTGAYRAILGDDMSITIPEKDE